MPELEADFADPWEHARLLSDAPRNRLLVELLRRRAPGAVVVEIGCGTGVLSCVAARLGARQVVALEPTPLWTTARALVAANGLTDRVTVLPYTVEAFAAHHLPDDWRGADLVFSELLNADPFAEGIEPASAAARALLAPGGHLAPDRLSVFAALVDAEAWRDLEGARAELARLAAETGLDLSAAEDRIGEAEPEPFVAPRVTLRSPPVRVLERVLGASDPVPDDLPVQLVATEPHRPVGGIAAWFEARYDHDLVMSNAPGRPTHWGLHVTALPEAVLPDPDGAVHATCLQLEDGLAFEVDPS